MLKKICIISYSSRKNGNCGRAAEYIAYVFEKSSRLYQIREVCFSDINFHICGHCDYECFHDMCKYDSVGVQMATRSMKGRISPFLRYFHSTYVSVRIVQVP